MATIGRLISRPSGIPTRERDCSNCNGDGWVESYPTLTAMMSNGSTRRVTCGQCDGDKKEEEDKPFIVYDKNQQAFIGWIEDQELPSKVGCKNAIIYPSWEDAQEDVSQYINRYTAKVTDLIFLAAEPE
jgi:RecJ-like exonuclease